MSKQAISLEHYLCGTAGFFEAQNGYQESENVRHIIETNDAVYKINVNHYSSLRSLTICGYSICIY